MDGDSFECGLAFQMSGRAEQSEDGRNRNGDGEANDTMWLVDRNDSTVERGARVDLTQINEPDRRMWLIIGHCERQ